MNVTNQSITILGAGLAGSLLAVLLARRGMQVHLIDRQADPRQREQPSGRSINLAMASRGIHALRCAALAGQLDTLKCPMPGRMMHDRDGSLTFQKYGSRDDDINYSVSRAALNHRLLDAAERHGARVTFEQRCDGYDPHTNTLHMCDARDANATYALRVTRLIAADGAGSPVRRGMADLDDFQMTEQLLEHTYQEVAIPPTSCGDYALDPEALHIWPRGGYMLIALPNPGKDFTATLFMAERTDAGAPSFELWQSRSDALQFFESEFPDVPELVNDLDAQLADNPRGVMGTVRCNRWHHRDQCLLIGDAAHAIVPFHGQGMNAGFEDCAALDAMIDRYPDWSSLFAAFSETRVPDANAIATMALENYVEMRDTVRDPSFHLKKALAFAVETAAPDIFVPRYSMVMFHDGIRYSEAQRRGKIQSELLSQWTSGCHSLRDINVGHCVAEARDALGALPEQHFFATL
ncbi:MAG: NAD(P)/FAD-dependent oxidoreductase [Pseudomonadota bacterium]